MPRALNAWILAVILFGVLPNGCGGSSGGGSVHIPPAQATAGQTTELLLELSVWGSRNSSVSSRYSSVVCKYRLRGDADFITGKMTLVREENKRAVYRFDLPAFAAEGSGQLEYFMEFDFDGVSNRRGSSVDPYTIPIKSRGNQTGRES